MLFAFMIDIQSSDILAGVDVSVYGSCLENEAECRGARGLRATFPGSARIYSPRGRASRLSMTNNLVSRRP